MRVMQGLRFSISATRLQAICSLAEGQYHAKPEYVVEMLLDYDWNPADDHQFWIDHAPIDEIVSWLRHL